MSNYNQVVEFVRANPDMKADAVAAALSVSKPSVYAYVRKARETGDLPASTRKPRSDKKKSSVAPVDVRGHLESEIARLTNEKLEAENLALSLELQIQKFKVALGALDSTDRAGVDNADPEVS